MVKPRVGEVWADRKGLEWGPLEENTGEYFLAEDYPLIYGKYAWTAEGMYFKEHTENNLDLVRLVRVSEADAKGLLQRAMTATPSGPYAELRRVLDAAFDQSASGKGAERHANHEAEAFQNQDIVAIPSRYGLTLAGPGFQVEKKLREANRMLSRGEHAKAKHEILGAIVYSAAAYLLIEKFERGHE